MFKERILEYYEGFTPGFRKLADFMLSNTLDVAFLTVSELARRVKVDPATVVRFSQEIGYSGYRELSREIKAYVHDQVTITYRKSEEGQTEEELLLALQQNAIQNLKHFSTTETGTLAKIVRILKDAPRVWVVGEYVSYELARVFAAELQIIEHSATAFHPNMAETAATLTQMQPGEVLFAIAIAHFGIDTSYAVKMAREKGLTTICLTGPGSLLPAREAEITLIAPTQSPISFASYDIPMMLLGLIWEGIIADSPGEKLAELFTNMYTNTSKVRELRAETGDYEIPPQTEG